MITDSVLDLLQSEQREYSLFRKTYSKNKRLYDIVLRAIRERFAKIQKRQSTESKIRIVRIEGRIKSRHSIIRKAIERGISVENIFDSICDIIGIRVVVNNLKDIEPLKVEIENIPEFSIKKVKEHPDEAGYRAVHLDVVYCFDMGSGEKKNFLCEIQIRTLFQDAWAVLSHHDVYKNKAELPKLAESISQNLSRLLLVLDKIADDFRTEIETMVQPPNDLSDNAPLDREGIAFLYYEIFGEKPEEYEVHHLTKMAEEYGLRDVGSARKGINKVVLNKLRRIHNKRFDTPAFNNLELFSYGLLFSKEGKVAYKEYRDKIESDWIEVEAIARREVLSAMPDTFEEFVDLVASDEVPWDAIKELGGGSTCGKCGCDVFDSYDAAEGVLDYYDNPDTDIDLAALLEEAAGNDIQSSDDGFCPYCAHQLAKDD